MGKQYSVVGDGSLAISQTESVTPNGCLVSSTPGGYEAEILTYPIKGMGSLFRPHIGDNDQFYLVLSRHLTFEGLSGSQVTEFLSLEDMPFRADAGDLRWSGETDLDKLL
jgi:hypothetical protein